MWDGSLGEIAATEHRIDLVPDARPIASPPYRAGLKAREAEQTEVNRMLEAGVIEPAQSAWASPVVLVPKPDGSLRFCVDYRRLNAVTIRDSYPLPRMDECIDSLGDATLFTTLDCNSGYWQIPVSKKDQDKTTFVCHAGMYRYKRMPFGLTNAPATFQRTLDILLGPYKWNSCLVYLDDVIIFSRDAESHIRHVEQVLNVLKDAGVSLKLKKCSFFGDRVKYLGHVIRPGSLEIDKTVTAALTQAKQPRTQTEVKSFLGLSTVYRRFVTNFTDNAAPLNALLRKGELTQVKPFGTPEITAFKGLIKAITEPPVLALPKIGLQYSIDTDASDYKVDASLFQTQADGTRQPIGFWSRSLLPAEKNYSISEKQCLAVVWAVTTLRPYLQGKNVIVHTDHSALRCLLQISEPSGRLMRWCLRLSEFDFEIRYKKGKLNTQADALSRLQTLGETTEELDEYLPCFVIQDIYEIEESDGDDEFFHPDHDNIIATMDPTPDSELLEPISVEERLTEQQKDHFARICGRFLAGDLPFRLGEKGILFRLVDAVPQVVVPETLKGRIMHHCHHAKLAGHRGGTKLYKTLRRNFYWPMLPIECHQTVRTCIECAKNRISLRRNSKRMTVFPVKARLEFIASILLAK